MQIHPDEQQANSYHLSGELCFNHISESKKQLLALLENSAEYLHLHLAEITDIDGAGLQILILLKNSAATDNKRLTLSNDNPIFLAILEACQLQTFFADSLVSTPEASA